ncbi:cytochrome P450 9e2-like [Athalia rosae]|uniref:cytochrome P450 9e2-like n=1 Tax=Athalia rosae TaxID=37344 RepID=UPI0020336719|nr:cytochrome P450 9e2-like [Athalia rosae]
MEVGNLGPVVHAILGILGISLIVYFWRVFTLMLFMTKNKVPYEIPLPFIGNMLPTLTKRISFGEFFINLYDKFPEAKYFGVFQFGKLEYVVRDLDMIKSVTVKNFEHFPDHMAFVDEVSDPLFGGNLFLMKGERWKEMRSIVSPVFTSSKMRGMFELISECADNLASYLLKQPRPLTLEMKDVFTRYTNDVIATTAFGIDVDSLENAENEFYLMGKDATYFGGLRTIKLFLFIWSPVVMRILGLTFLSRKVSKFFCDLVGDTVSTREKNGIQRPDLINLLMQAKHKQTDEKLTIKEITSQAFIFFVAGFDTSSTLMCFTSHQLAINPDIQDKLIAEIDDAVEEEGGKLSYEKVNQLRYLEMVLNETLRYYPPAVVTDRINTHVSSEFPPATEGGNPIQIKPGSRILIPIIAIHRDPKYFPDPQKFDPDRFSPENKNNINPFAFIPFGAGPRNCPGNRFALMETKLVLCSILRKFKFRVSAKTHLPLVLSRSTISMTAEHGFWLDLEPRITSTA